MPDNITLSMYRNFGVAKHNLPVPYKGSVGCKVQVSFLSTFRAV